MTETHTAENLTEGDEVEMTLETDDGEQTGSLEIKNVKGATAAIAEGMGGVEVTLNFAGQYTVHEDSICSLTKSGRELGTVVELEGY